MSLHFMAVNDFDKFRLRRGVTVRSETEIYQIVWKILKSPATQQPFLSLQSARGPPGNKQQEKKKTKKKPVRSCVCEQVCLK